MENLAKENSAQTNNKNNMDVNSSGDFIRKNSEDNFNLKYKESSRCCANCSNYGASNELTSNSLKPIPSHHLMLYERASLLYDEMQNSVKTWPSQNFNNGSYGDGTLMDRNNWIHSNQFLVNPPRCSYNSNCCSAYNHNHNSQCPDLPNFYSSGNSNGAKYSEERIKNLIAKHDEDNSSKVYGIVCVSFLLITFINWLINSIECSLELVKKKLGKFLNSIWSICDYSVGTKNHKSIQLGMILLSPFLMVLGGLYSLICLGVSVQKILKRPVPVKLMKVFNLKYLLNTAE